MSVANPVADVNAAADLERALRHHIRYTLARPTSDLSPAELVKPLALALRDRLVDGLLDTEQRYQAAGVKRLYYFSMEYLMGRSLSDNLCNLQLHDLAREVLAGLGFNLDDVIGAEPEAGLGNAGLGRLAACLLESLATLGMPGFGYGIDYEYGLFRQEIAGGYQREKPDLWKAAGTPPLYIERPNEICLVPLYGRLEARSSNGTQRQAWVDWKTVVGLPHDLPVAGYGGRTVNFLRLFSARSSEDFDIDIFNRGDYIQAVEQKIASENISRVLYPSDSVVSGRELRLLQEYFLVACALRDIVRRYQATHSSFDQFPDQVAIQLNDTHPSLAVAELMRILVDEKDLDWDKAWEITQATLAYTNHTLLPEALEKWSVPLLEAVLPRHMEIIFAINHQFLRAVVQRWPLDADKLRNLSIIEEGHEKQARMAHLAIIGCHSVNGVSELHSQLLRTSLAPDFAQMWPAKFNNKTNGVSHRRWLLKANPEFAALLTRTLGNAWITNLEAIRGLEEHAADAGFQSEFLAIKRRNKQKLAAVVLATTGFAVDPASMFDVQVKRIHEYKRQLLHILRIIDDYLRLIQGSPPLVPRTCIFAGKAAPGYWAAKQIIKLIHNVALVVNRDARAQGRLRVVFIPDYAVSLAEVIIPAADLSEQISTAGMEASGTGNMKLAMNGALTIGTLDGANIEIMRAVGEDNFYAFGLAPEQVRRMREQGLYHPRSIYNNDAAVHRALDALNSDLFCPEESGLFRWIVSDLLERGDHYFYLADMPSYLDAGRQAEHDFLDSALWARKAVLNVSRIGRFSSDRTVLEYARDIWQIRSVE